MKNKRFNPDSITNEKLISELQGLGKKLNRTPSQSDMKNGTSITKRVYLYRRRFGSIKAAQKAAGFSANLGGAELKYNEQDLLDEIIRLKNLIGKTPTQRNIGKYGKYPIGAYKRNFGTYNNALDKIQVRCNVKRHQDVEDIKADIVRVSKNLGRSPKAEEFSKLSNTVSWITATKKIDDSGSWNNALKKCGLEVVYNKNLTEQELKDEIIKLRTHLKRVPGYYDMIQLGKYSPESYAFKYGTYIKALKYFGFDYMPVNQWQNQQYTKCKDGEVYKSKFEALVADILFDLKSDNYIISYEYEKRVCTDRQWTCDFYIRNNEYDLWLEADGMEHNRKTPYNEGNEKIQYYLDNSFNFYVLRYSDIDIKKTLKEKL